MSDLGFNVWGAVAGAIGALALIPALLALLQLRLPSTTLPRLLDSFKETRELFSAAIRDGLITDEIDLREFNINIWAANMRVDAIRASVYAARTWRQDVANWWHGLSGRIEALCEELNVIRVKLAERNSLERKRLAAKGVAADISWIKECSEYGIFYDNAQRPPTYDTGSRRLSAARLHSLIPSTANPQSSAVSTSAMGFTAGRVMEIGKEPMPAEKARRGPTHHLISDDDLQGLLSFALSSRLDDRRPGRATRDPATSISARSSYAPRSGRTGRGGTHAKRQPARTPLEALLRLMQRSYGARARTFGDSPVDRLLDPESLTILGARATESDADDWEDTSQ